jgi:hypothetical protein
VISRGKLRTDEKNGNPLAYGAHEHQLSRKHYSRTIKAARAMLKETLALDRSRTREAIYEEISRWIEIDDPEAIKYWPPLHRILQAEEMEESGMGMHNGQSRENKEMRSSIEQKLVCVDAMRTTAILSEK